MGRNVPFGLSNAAVFGVLAALLVILLMGTPADADASGAPSAPSLYQPVTTHNSVTLKWVAVEDPSDSGIRYVVERSVGTGYSRASGSTRKGGSYSDGAVAILFTDRSLDPDTYYSYRVYAVQGSEWSSSSGSVTARTDSAPETYVAPEPTPEATPESTPEATPEATPVVTDETTPVVTEETTPVVTDEDAGQQTNTEPGEGETLKDDGATENAVDPATETKVEDEKDTILNEQDGGLNEQDTSVTRTTTTDTAITLTWNTAVDATLGTVTGYRIWWGTSTTRVTVSNDVESLAGDTVEVNRSSATPRSQEFSGLSPYTTYYFWVAPLFGTETDAADRTAGRISSRMIVTTEHASNSPSRVRDLTATEQSNGDVQLDWTAAEAATDCAVSGHKLSLRAVNSGARSSVSQNTTGVTYTWDASAFEAGKRYIFGVQATCGTDNKIVGEEAFVALTMGPDANTPPTVSLYAPFATSEGVRLQWWTQENPTDENWTFIVERRKSPNDWETISGTYGDSFEYRSETNADGGGGWGTVFYDYAVQPDSWYKYRVTTVDQDNSNAESAVSTSRLVRTPLATVATAPGVPTNVTATWVNGTVRVRWDAPEDNGGSAITGFQILRFNTTIATLNDPVFRTLTDATVEAGQSYNFYVRAINANGMSDKSAPAYVVTEASNIAPVVHEQPEPNSPSGNVTLAEVTNVTDGDATMTVEWTHGTAGERVCNTDYHIVLGVNGIFKRGVTSVATLNPFVTISGYWYVLTHDPIGPYTRSVTAEIGGTWSDADPVPDDEIDISKLSVAVYCGHADNGDRVGKADATIA